jgi:hypothetical protein
MMECFCHNSVSVMMFFVIQEANQLRSGYDRF